MPVGALDGVVEGDREGALLGCPDGAREGGEVSQMLSVQLPEMQSVCTKQTWSFAHGGHGPPQSTSVSKPVLMPSLQD